MILCSFHRGNAGSENLGDLCSVIIFSERSLGLKPDLLKSSVGLSPLDHTEQTMTNYLPLTYCLLACKMCPLMLPLQPFTLCCNHPISAIDDRHL